MKIIGLKKAVGDFNRANAEGKYSPRYGYLMFDKSTSEVWTDEFYSVGRNQWKEYASASVFRIDDMMKRDGIDVVSMMTVRAFIEGLC